MTVQSSFRIEQVHRITGMSKVMIDYLCRSSILKPSVAAGKRGRGKRRLFSYSDLLYVKSIHALLSKGVSVKRVAACLKELQKECRSSCEASEFSEIRLLVTNGSEVFRLSDKNTLESVTKKGQFEFAFVLDHARLRSEIDKSLQQSAG